MSSNLTWETVYTYNLGLDLSFLQNRLSFTGDFFIRDTKDMLTQSLTLPSVYGAATPTENCADLRTKGWELSITWRDQFKLGGKPFHYALTGQIGDYQTEITKYNNPTKLFDSYYEGKKLGEIWGYHVPKLFDTDEEAAAYQVAINNSSNVYQRVYNMQNNLGRLMAGDVMFEDRDGSGSIGTGAGTVDDPGDMMIIGNTTPRYSYSFRIEASWNGFDISAFFQGVGKRDWYPTANKDDIYGANQFWQLYGYTIPSFITYDFMDDVWSEQNPGGYFPRLRPIRATTAAAGTEQRPLPAKRGLPALQEPYDRLHAAGAEKVPLEAAHLRLGREPLLLVTAQKALQTHRSRAGDFQRHLQGRNGNGLHHAPHLLVRRRHHLLTTSSRKEYENHL